MITVTIIIPKVIKIPGIPTVPINQAKICFSTFNITLAATFMAFLATAAAF